MGPLKPNLQLHAISEDLQTGKGQEEHVQEENAAAVN